MSVHKIRAYTNLRRMWRLANEMRLARDENTDHTPEKIFRSLCENEDGGFHDCTIVQGGLLDGQNMAVIANPDLARRILRHEDVKRDVRPVKFFSLSGADGIASSEGPQWQRQKADAVSYLSAKKIENDYLDIEAAAIKDLMCDMSRQVEANGSYAFLPKQMFKEYAFKNLSDEMGFGISTDVMSDISELIDRGFRKVSSLQGLFHLVMDMPYHIGQDKTNAALITRVSGAFDATIDEIITRKARKNGVKYTQANSDMPDGLTVRGRAVSRPVPYTVHSERDVFFESFLPVSLHQDTKLHRETMMEGIIRNQVQAYADEHDMDVDTAYQALAQNPSDLGQVYRDQIKEEAFHVIYAGHETSGNLLAWATHKMASDPALQDRLYDAVKEYSDEDLNKGAILRDPVTKGFVYELLRLYPSLGNTIPRIAQKDISVTFENHDGEEETISLKAGTYISLPIILYHTNPAYYDQPHEFDIDRPLNPRAFMAFFAGPNICPGRNLALTRTAIALGHMIKNYNFSGAGGKATQMPLKSYHNGMDINPGTKETPVYVTRRPTDAVDLKPANRPRAKSAAVKRCPHA